MRHDGELQRQALDPDAVPALEHPEKANLVKLRYFAALNLAEAAEALGLSERTERAGIGPLLAPRVARGPN